MDRNQIVVIVGAVVLVGSLIVFQYIKDQPVPLETLPGCDEIEFLPEMNLGTKARQRELAELFAYKNDPRSVRECEFAAFAFLMTCKTSDTFFGEHFANCIDSVVGGKEDYCHQFAYFQGQDRDLAYTGRCPMPRSPNRRAANCERVFSFARTYCPQPTDAGPTR